MRLLCCERGFQINPFFWYQILSRTIWIDSLTLLFTHIYKIFIKDLTQGVRWIHWSFFSGIFLLGGSHLWPYLVNMGTSIIWCDSNIKVQYFSVWLWYTLSQNLRERLQEFKSQLFHCFVFILTDNFFNAVDCNSVVNF